MLRMLAPIILIESMLSIDTVPAEIFGIMFMCCYALWAIIETGRRMDKWDREIMDRRNNNKKKTIDKKSLKKVLFLQAG